MFYIFNYFYNNADKFDLEFFFIKSFIYHITRINHLIEYFSIIVAKADRNIKQIKIKKVK